MFQKASELDRSSSVIRQTSCILRIEFGEEDYGVDPGTISKGTCCILLDRFDADISLRGVTLNVRWDEVSISADGERTNMKLADGVDTSLVQYKHRGINHTFTCFEGSDAEARVRRLESSPY